MKQADYHKFAESLSDEQKRFLARYVTRNPVRFLRELMGALKKIEPAKSPEPWATDQRGDADHPYAILRWTAASEEDRKRVVGRYECFLACGCGEASEYVFDQIAVVCKGCKAVYMASGGIGVVKVATAVDGKFPDDAAGASNANAGTAHVPVEQETTA